MRNDSDYKSVNWISFQMTCDNGLKSVDFYDSKFDLGALSIADLSLQSSSDTQDFAEFKRAIKFSLFFQPAFSVCWFLGVVALENRQSCIMPVTFIICYNILVSIPFLKWTISNELWKCGHLKENKTVFSFQFYFRIGTFCIVFQT